MTVESGKDPERSTTTAFAEPANPPGCFGFCLRSLLEDLIFVFAF